MRAPGNLWKAGLSAAAAVVLLTACGGSDEESDASSGSSSSSSSAGSSSSSSAGSSSSGGSGSSDEDVQAFCTQAEQVFTGLSDDLDAANPTDIGTALDQSVAQIEEIEPPAEISADWETLKGALTGLRDAVKGADLSTTEGQTAVSQAVTDLTAQSTGAQTRIDEWSTANCDNA